MAVALGVHAAMTDAPLDEAWGDAVASDPVEGAEIAYRANVERTHSRIKRRTAGQQPKE